MLQNPGRLFSVGVDKYGDARLLDLDHAVADVNQLSGLLRRAFIGEPLADVTEFDVRTALAAIRASLPSAGPLVVAWAGHGNPGVGAGFRLLTTDSDDSGTTGLLMIDLASQCASSGANQILFLLDLCYSGEAVAQAVDVAAALLQALAPEGPAWVGALASCRGPERARDGMFGAAVRQLLTKGPNTPELRVRWSRHNQLIRGDDLCDAVVKEWNADGQRPDFQMRGDAWRMLPNPLYDPGAPEQVVEHLLLAARGGHGERSWFTGRQLEVDTVIGWAQSGEPGLHVVTGSAGTGKSAIVGRVVSLAYAEERRRLLNEGRPLGHADPGVGSITAHVHARGLTADAMADLLGDQLVSRGVLQPRDERRNANALLGDVQYAIEHDSKPIPVVVVDGLDEARTEAFAIAEDLLVRLARWVTVLVSTRRIPRDEKPELVALLQISGGDLLDLDAPAAHQRTLDDVRRYVVERLTGVDPRMDPEAIANEMLA